MHLLGDLREFCGCGVVAFLYLVVLLLLPDSNPWRYATLGVHTYILHTMQ